MDGRRVGEGASGVNCRPDRGRYIASGRSSGDSDVRSPRRTAALRSLGSVLPTDNLCKRRSFALLPRRRRFIVRRDVHTANTSPPQRLQPVCQTARLDTVCIRLSTLHSILLIPPTYLLVCLLT